MLIQKPKDFYKVPGSYHSALVISIYLYICLFICLLFTVNKFLLANVNNNFLLFKTFKTFLTHRSSPPEMFSWREVSAGVLRILGGTSVRGCDFNKVAKRLC